MKTYYNSKHIEIISALILTFSLFISVVADGFMAAATVRQECLRLHILADSDAEEAQSVKLLVRDRLLESSEEIFTGNESSEEAAEKILRNKEKLEEIANEVLRENGFFYTASISVEDEYFETRQYDNMTLPAGTYKACKVILGSGEGKNWWCVMFPPLCIPAAVKNNEDEVYAVFGEDGGDLVTEKNGYVIRFRVVELFEEALEKIRSRKK